MQQIRNYIKNTLQSLYTDIELKNITMALCTDVLNISRNDVYLRKDINLSSVDMQKLESAVARLAQSEPIQYVVGKAFFYDSYFNVKPGVLIPRPETEELVELILRENKGSYRLLDIGTGSGCIAISIAKNNKLSNVEAWDISDDALSISSNNAEELGVDVTFNKRDVLSFKPKNEQFDIIVSNPPYIRYVEQEVMEKNVLDWEPQLALFVPNDDPLLFYRRIATLGLDMLFPQGKLYFEINQAFGAETAKMLTDMGYSDVQVLKDLYGNDRIVNARK